MGKGRAGEGACRARAAAVRVDLVEQRAQQPRGQQRARAAQRRAQAAVARAGGPREVGELLAVDRAVPVGVQDVEQAPDGAATIAVAIAVGVVLPIGVLGLGALGL